MGNCFFGDASHQIIEAVQQLQTVENTLSTLINKYNKQIVSERQLARRKLNNKTEAMHHVKKGQIIRHHKNKLEQRLESCMHKRLQLESLNVTKMHLKAVKQTAKTFKQFLNENDIEKVEQLQDALSGMISDACEINETLQTDSFEVDEDEILQEYENMCESVQLADLPVAPVTPLNTFFEDNEESEAETTTLISSGCRS